MSAHTLASIAGVLAVTPRVVTHFDPRAKMQTDKPLYIFDLDGTLALTEHRNWIIQDPEPRSDKWRRFYGACDKDAPNEQVIAVMDRMRLFADVWIWTGRSDEVRGKTVNWLAQYTTFMSGDLERGILTMRQEGDYTPDDVLKKQWLDNMLVDDRRRLAATFEDRGRVVKMWRDAGVTCFQVAAGEF